MDGGLNAQAIMDGDLNAKLVSETVIKVLTTRYFKPLLNYYMNLCIVSVITVGLLLCLSGSMH